MVLEAWQTMPVNMRQQLKTILLGIAKTTEDTKDKLEATKQLAELLQSDKPLRRRRKGIGGDVFGLKPVIRQ
jgi:hypothetical protein